TPHNIQRVWSRGLEFVFNNEILLYKKEPFPKVETDIYIIEVTEKLRDTSSNLNAEIQKKSKSNIVKLITGLLYTYSLSTTEESNVLNDFSIGKQIPYVPRYQAKANIGIQWNSLSIEYIQTYTGYRFVTTDESQYLKPFTTGNIFMSYQFNFKQHSVQGSFRFNNLFNENYEGIVGRVMPRRNISLGLRFDIR
ncbi:MAG TPA: TonB-dependent receptor, partial [Chitinophagaceae bacterium]|nr:TonB-dependent receptor [Chitinophagaceae bacterium]